MILQKRNIRDRKSRTISQFLRESHKFSVLSNEELLPLIKAAQAGDIEARHKVCNSNYRLLFQEALSCYKTSNYPISDLIQEGFIGLNNAITHFDFSQNVPFYPYSRCAIKRAIILFLRREGTSVRIPINIEPQLHRIRDAYSMFSQREGREPDIEELSGLIDISRDLLESFYSLESSEYNGKSLENLEAEVERDTSIPQEDTLKLRRVLSLLPEEDRVFISKFFGIDGTRVPISTLAREMGKSIEWVRLYKVRILDQLRVLLN